MPQAPEVVGAPHAAAEGAVSGCDGQQRADRLLVGVPNRTGRAIPRVCALGACSLSAATSFGPRRRRRAYAEADAGAEAEAAVRSLEERIAFAHSSHVACREASDALARARTAWAAITDESLPASRLARLAHGRPAYCGRLPRAGECLAWVEHNEAPCMSSPSSPCVCPTLLADSGSTGSTMTRLPCK